MSDILAEVSAATAAVVARHAPSVVALSSGRHQWSGIAWRPGLIVTAEEALPHRGDVEARFADGSTAKAEVAGRDPSTDVAVLRVARSDLTAVAFGNVVPPVGALAIAVGAGPHGATAGLGMIAVSAGPWTSMRGAPIARRIEVETRLRRSAEGGLAVDASGQAFGMLVRGARRRILVIPGETIAPVADRLEKHGRIPRGYLGLAMQPVTIEGGGHGLLVMSVDTKGPAASAGMHQGDILVAWDGAPISGLRPLMRVLGPDSVGRSVAIDVRRGGVAQRIMVTVGERPSA